MRTFKMIFCGGCIVLLMVVSATAMTVDEALVKLKTYRFGQMDDVLNTITESALQSVNDPNLRVPLAEGLAQVLESEAAYDAKFFASRQLALVGTEQQVPTLAKLLTDEEMSQMARYALARIPGEAADRAFVEALEQTEGRDQLGIINTLGNRRCRGAVEPLIELLKHGPRPVATEAARALGRIGTATAADALSRALARRSRADRNTVADAYLNCAARLRLEGDNNRAAFMYRRILDSDLPGHLRGAALNATGGGGGDGFAQFLGVGSGPGHPCTGRPRQPGGAAGCDAGLRQQRCRRSSGGPRCPGDAGRRGIGPDAPESGHRGQRTGTGRGQAESDRSAGL